jgi:ubiquinone biosynthesis protein COQ4
MTDAAAPVAYPDRHRRPPLRPLKAVRAFGRLVRDKEDTVQVFEIMRALTGDSTWKGYERLIREPGGGEIAYARPELASRFSDPQWLARFGPGTVGAAYREFTTAERISADGLVAQSRVSTPEIDEAHVITWYARRLRDVHDVWHILTGYGRDALGEACLVAFSYSQTGHMGFGFLALGAARQIGREGVNAWPAVMEAFRHGRRAAWLPAQDYERLFAEPLEQARWRLKLRTPSRYFVVPEETRRQLTLQTPA